MAVMCQPALQVFVSLLIPLYCPVWLFRRGCKISSCSYNKESFCFYSAVASNKREMITILKPVGRLENSRWKGAIPRYWQPGNTYAGPVCYVRTELGACSMWTSFDQGIPKDGIETLLCLVDLVHSTWLWMWWIFQLLWKWVSFLIMTSY